METVTPRYSVGQTVYVASPIAGSDLPVGSLVVIVENYADPDETRYLVRPSSGPKVHCWEFDLSARNADWESFRDIMIARVG